MKNTNPNNETFLDLLLGGEKFTKADFILFIKQWGMIFASLTIASLLS